ncbi:MAG: hypothetical protein A2654_00515 [Candidatus Nealsonbacteria bacterium RIFCSPHIGHO2_01_FULL_43_31]|uniref:Uncharacterized protein n=2 Tax=Candidatus Nealsoniibacteriota TaxID=1817911 RepID=A0A1G2EA30_9BACT|nr:MAG: hypothetical protein A2654_00515 [Candidatus Nealsonbacteria bacterium RIFCSPHIGHO2_01_FULL_43_31]OGZ22131.1 MAG: hypothetical protein A3D46_02270 [Candidatus Nealsonbacteria bacterium RIFCSPHIGHO2_02_FULL_43_13]OGZ25541.1 MAG: hypothetical protein A2922_00895 [Candidatus Nealsonbacteria bacterium RIFCSPLOWO2_01_FULL_43_36]
MDKDFSEIIEYLDGKFSGVDEKFSGIDEKFSGIDGRLIDLDNKIEELKENKADKSDISTLMSAIDAYAKKADTYFQEMVMLSHKVNRLEKWIQEIAEKVGIRLEY